MYILKWDHVTIVLHDLGNLGMGSSSPNSCCCLLYVVIQNNKNMVFILNHDIWLSLKPFRIKPRCLLQYKSIHFIKQSNYVKKQENQINSISEIQKYISEPIQKNKFYKTKQRDLKSYRSLGSEIFRSCFRSKQITPSFPCRPSCSAREQKKKLPRQTFHQTHSIRAEEILSADEILY